MEDKNVLEYLESRLKDNPKSLLFARLADLYLEQGKIDDGMILCTEGVKHHPYYSTGYYVLAKAHVLKKEYDKAESALKKVLSHDQQYLAAHKMLADIMVKTGWESTAVEHYSAVLEIDPLEDKIRDRMKRYASKPVPKTPLLEPSEDPSTAIDEIPSVETKPAPVPQEEPEIKSEPEAVPPALPETVLPTVLPETASQEMEFESLPDWTDQIKEFNPDEIDLPASSPPLAPETTFDAFEAPPEIPADQTAAGAPGEPPDTEPAAAEASEPDLLQSFPSQTDAEKESDAALSEKPAVDGGTSPGEKLVDFTQDWFDLSSFEKPEPPPPKEKRAAKPPLEIVEAGPGPAETPKTEPDSGSLFEKDEPREILTPSDLLPDEPEKPRKIPPPVPPPQKPAETRGPAAHKRPVDFRTPRKAEAKEPAAVPPPAPAEPVHRVEPKSPPTPKSDAKPELKIVTSTLGEIYAVQGQFDKAIQVYEALLEKNPKEQKYLDKIADLKKKLKEASGK
jgi:tetratricopeptide (TPR) repeat protein